MTVYKIPSTPKLHGETPRTALRRRLSFVGGWQTLLVTGLALAASCGSESVPSGERLSARPAAEVGQVASALAGKDGALTVVLPNVALNSYAAVTADIAPGDKTIKVTGIAALSLSVGDLIMIVQMQGATLDFTDTINYGTVTNYNGAGRYEFATVTGVSVVAGTIAVAACNGGIRNAYSTAGHTQVVRVPQYTTLTVNNGGSIIAPAWDGTTGGVVAIHAQTAVALNGSINVTGKGFRPGLLDNDTSDPNMGQRIYRSTMSALGGEKGEGIGGYSADYDASGGRYGRGAPGNGGGGGNAHNAGGGGGANASNGRAWGKGQGVMDSTIVGGAAWTLDPGYIANGNKVTTDGGGGRGGYTFGAANQNALTVGPNNAAWGGDQRSEVGGLGGRPLDPGVTQRLFLGGGGGAGDGNNSAANQGGAGGGLVFLATPSVTGTGSIIASGTVGGDTKNSNNDAPGGGGGGGTIVVAAQTLTGISATANGGSGGNQLTIGDESEGPGGGGGGGFIAVSGGTIVTTVNGASAGTTQSTALKEFPANGGTSGSPGNTASAQPLIPLIAALDCSATMADLAVSITNSLNGAPATPGSTIQYTVVYQNLSTTNPVKAASIADTIPPGVTPQSVSWTCTAQGTAVCPAQTGTGNIPPAQVDLPAGSGLTYTVKIPVPATANGQFNYSAAIQAPLDINDPSLGNNTATNSVKLPGADLAVYVSDNLQGKNAQPGSPVSYTVTIANIGGSAANGVVLTDALLPAGVTIAAWTCTASGAATCPAASGTGPLANNQSNLPGGGTVVYQVTTSAIPAGALGTLTYRLTVAPPVGQTDSDPTNNQAISSHPIDNATIPATGSDLSLKLSHNPQKLFPGQDVTYTAQVSNAGPQAVTNATVVFSVPVGSIIKTPAAGTGWVCTQAGTVASCIAATLPAGDAPPINIVITNPTTPVAGGAPVAKGAVSASKNTDPNPGNDSATDLGSLPKADLSLTIDRSPQTPQPGDEVTYTLTASNSGPDPAPTPSVVFTIPAGGTVTMPPAGTGWTCTQQDDTVTCVRPDLAQGAAPPITVKVKLPTEPTTSTPPLVVQVGSPSVEDPNLDNNRAVSATPTAPSTKADLGITLTRDPAASLPGQVVTFTAIVTNLGNDTVYSPTVTFQLPPGGVVVQPAQGSGWVCQQAGDTVTCERSSLAVGPAPPITVKLLTPIEPTGNSGAGTGTVAVSVAAVRNNDPNPANDHAVVAAGSLPTSNTDLSIAVTRDPLAPNAGDEQTITVLVTNKGQDPAGGVAVTVQVPPDTQVVQPAQGEGWRCIPNGQTYLCTRDRLDVGPAPAITLKVITPGPTATGEAPQVGASVDAASAMDPTPADNSTQLPIGAGAGGSFKLNGGGFSCAMDPTSPAWPTVQLAFGALLTVLLRRRRRS